MEENAVSRHKPPASQPMKVQGSSDLISIWDWSDPIYEDDPFQKKPVKIKPIKSLKTLCVETLARNVDSLYEMERYPPDLTKLFLKDCKVDSLYWFERRNQLVKEHTDELWEKHFKGRYPRSNLHLSLASTQGWRHCYMIEKKAEADKAKRYAEKQKAAQEALRNKRQTKVETLSKNHSIFLSPYERSKVEAQALRANPDFERIRRQTIQRTHQFRNDRRPLPTPAGIPIGLTLPISTSTRTNSSPSMSPPAVRNNHQRPWSPDSSPPNYNTSYPSHFNSQRTIKPLPVSPNAPNTNFRRAPLPSATAKKEGFKER